MYVHQEDRARLLELYNQQDIINNFEAEIRRRDKAIIWISINVRPVRVHRGKIILLEGTVVDITARKKAEEEINKLNRELEENIAQRTSELHNTQLALLNLVDDLNAPTRDVSLIMRLRQPTRSWKRSAIRFSTICGRRLGAWTVSARRSWRIMATNSMPPGEIT